MKQAIPFLPRAVARTCLAVSLCVALAACSSSAPPQIQADTPAPAAAPIDPSFAKGADISWVTEMEKNGLSFKNRA
ncbi:MAG: hypothetical protein ACLGI6_19155, partial [Gammaproteobacteria bacterium]